MTTPQLIITLSPQGELVTELPGLNGSRRKINLKIKSNLVEIIGKTIEYLNAIENLSDLVQKQSEATKISNLTHKPLDIQRAKRAENAVQTAQMILSETSQLKNNLNSILTQDETVTETITRILEGQQNSKHAIGEDGNPTDQQVKHWMKHSGIWGDPLCPFCISEGRFEKGKNREDTRKLRGLTEYEALRLGLISRGFKQSKNNSEIWLKGNISVFLKPNAQIMDNKRVIWSKTHRDNLIQDGKNYAKIHGFKIEKPTKTQNATVRTVRKLVKETQEEKLQRKVGRLNF